ncbi:hypothetical protein NDU88_010832 [Pleurodeles waltl]|uniref:Uncharacterized protein n=1 Tax=Pleurodeles waltl TaxID=8319 RepID=A0AAV7S1X8_PLEWA|nr:hypothetical protein NDU88_010832 [Pleurodeles waltl]
MFPILRKRANPEEDASRMRLSCLGDEARLGNARWAARGIPTVSAHACRRASRASLLLLAKLAINGTDKLGDRLWLAICTVYTRGTPTTAAVAAASAQKLRPQC